MAKLVTTNVNPGKGINFSGFGSVGSLLTGSYEYNDLGTIDFVKLYDTGTPDVFVEFRGTGFMGRLDGNGTLADITAGTIKSWTVSVNGVVPIKLTGAHVSASDLFDSMVANDTSQFLSLLFGGHDTMAGTQFADVFYGLGGNDTMDGGAGNDVLEGGDGNDAIKGGSGNDKLLGGDGLNTLNGGTGNDTLTSGRHADVFSYDSLDFDKDRILKWQDGLDKIDLVGAGFDFADFSLYTGGQQRRADTDRRPHQYDHIRGQEHGAD